MKKREFELFDELSSRLTSAQEDVVFLLSAFVGVSHDIACLEKNGVIRPEIESIKKILDGVYNHFGRADNDR